MERASLWLNQITRVLVVDDYEPWHSFYKEALRTQANLQVIGTVSDGVEAMQQTQELQPHLILLDIELPKLNGIEAARRIREVSPVSKILFVSESHSAEIIEKALSTGASGYVVKSDAESDLLPAVEAVLEGKRFVSASVTGRYNPYLRFAGSASISKFLASIMAATAADFGAVQLFDSTNNVLRIVVGEKNGVGRRFKEGFKNCGGVHRFHLRRGSLDPFQRLMHRKLSN